jgi:micrococcal nuclease
MYQYKIKKINRIIDGDTVDLDIDLGFGLTLSQKVRLKGINTPETKTLNIEEKSKGLEAKEWLKKELSHKKEWIIETNKEDKYGRILGTIYSVGESISINEKMLNEGIAKPYTIK